MDALLAHRVWCGVLDQFEASVKIIQKNSQLVNKEVVSDIISYGCLLFHHTYPFD